MKKATIITLLLFLSWGIKAQLLTETFESGTFPPTGWLNIQDCADPDDDEEIIWEQQDDFETVYNTYGWAHTGSFAAVSSFGFMDEYASWLITPQFTPTNDHHVLHFFFKQAYGEDYDSEFQIKVSTASQNTLTDFTILESITEADAPLNYEEHTVDLSAYIGTPIYIAFINYDDDGDGDEWYLDDVTMEPIAVPGPTLNPLPADGATGINIVNTQTSQIDLMWEAPNTGGPITQYDLWLGTQPDHLRILGHPSGLSAHPKTFHFNTVYYWKAAAVNMSGESSNTWSFTTCDFPTATAPYTVDFENNGFVPDGMDQSVENGKKFWHFSNDPTAVSHFGNATSANGTQSESGGYFAFVKDIGTPSPNGTVMFTSYVDISALNTPGMQLYVISDNEGSLNVTLTVYAKNGTDWINVFTHSGNTNGWAKNVIDLSGFNLPDQTQFKFVVTEPSGSDNHDDIAIDDFKVAELNTLANHTIAMDDFKLFPNPVKDILLIQSENTPKKVELFDLQGKLLLQVLSQNQINLSKLPAGTYLIKIYNHNNQSITKKVMKL